MCSVVLYCAELLKCLSLVAYLCCCQFNESLVASLVRTLAYRIHNYGFNMFICKSHLEMIADCARRSPLLFTFAVYSVD